MLESHNSAGDHFRTKLLQLVVCMTVIHINHNYKDESALSSTQNQKKNIAHPLQKYLQNALISKNPKRSDPKKKKKLNHQIVYPPQLPARGLKKWKNCYLVKQKKRYKNLLIYRNAYFCEILYVDCMSLSLFY